MSTTAGTTAILEAGRKSLDAGGRPFVLTYADATGTIPTGMAPEQYSS